MRHRLTALAVVLACGLVAGQQPTPAMPTPLYPLKVGNKWTYTAGKDSIELLVKGVEKVDKEDVYELVTSRNGTPEANEHVVVREDGVYRTRVAGMKVTPPMRLLKLPVKKGETWDVNSQVGMEKLAGKLTFDEGEVMWMGKPTKATIVKGVDMTANGQKMSLAYYFVENVGMVRQAATFAGATVTLELKMFEGAK
jgi:hypothetical protein